MRIAHAINVLLAVWPTVALANPTVDVGECIVTIVKAPAEVRAEIDKWVGGEHHCTTTLTLTVVATDAGFYLYGRDGLGRVHDRVVPDAQTAGVLVASWIADDSVVPVVVVPEPDRRASLDQTLRPPGATALAAEAGVLVDRSEVRRAPPPGHGRWLTVGALGLNDIYGGRAHMDLIGAGKWSLGVGLAFWKPTSAAEDYPFAEINATASLARRWSPGPLQLEVHVAAGLTRTSDWDFRNQYGIYPMVEYGAQIGFKRDRWAFVAGPIVTQIAREQLMTYPTSSVFVTIFGGLRHRL